MSRLKLRLNIPDSKSHRLKEASLQRLSADRQNSSTDPRLQAGIMPVPIEIFDSDPGPVWSCMPSHCACIFSGLQVSGHDSAQGKRTQIKWTITHKLMELSAPTLTFFWGGQTWQRCVSFSPFYVPTIDSCCNSLRNIMIIKKTKNKVDSCVLDYLFIMKTWFRGLAVCLAVGIPIFGVEPLRNK